MQFLLVDSKRNYTTYYNSFCFCEELVFVIFQIMSLLWKLKLNKDKSETTCLTQKFDPANFQNEKIAKVGSSQKQKKTLLQKIPNNHYQSTIYLDVKLCL